MSDDVPDLIIESAKPQGTRLLSKPRTRVPKTKLSRSMKVDDIRRAVLRTQHPRKAVDLLNRLYEIATSIEPDRMRAIELYLKYVIGPPKTEISVEHLNGAGSPIQVVFEVHGHGPNSAVGSPVSGAVVAPRVLPPVDLDVRSVDAERAEAEIATTPEQPYDPKAVIEERREEAKEARAEERAEWAQQKADLREPERMAEYIEKVNGWQEKYGKREDAA